MVRYAAIICVLVLVSMAGMSWASDVAHQKQMQQTSFVGEGDTFEAAEEVDVNITINTGDDAMNSTVAKVISSIAAILIAIGALVAAIKKATGKKADSTKST